MVNVSDKLGQTDSILTATEIKKTDGERERKKYKHDLEQLN